MKYCSNLRWIEDPSGDYYCCALGMETSEDWCEGESSYGKCPLYDPIDTEFNRG